MLPVGQLVASANAEIQGPLELGWQNQTWGLVREWCLPPSKNDEPWGWFSFSLGSVLDLSSSGCSLALGNAVLLASFAPACGVPCPVVGWFCLLAAGIKSLNFAVSGWLTAWMGFLGSWPTWEEAGAVWERNRTSSLPESVDSWTEFWWLLWMHSSVVCISGSLVRKSVY